MLKEIDEDLKTMPVLSIKETLCAYVDKALLLQKRINELNEELDTYTGKYRTLTHSELPAFFLSQGITEFTTKTGSVFTLKTYVAAKIKDEPKFFAWLKESNNEEFLKNELVVDIVGDSSSIEEALKKEQLAYTIKKRVHPQTLNALVRRAMEGGETLPEDSITIDSGNFVKLT